MKSNNGELHQTLYDMMLDARNVSFLDANSHFWKDFHMHFRRIDSVKMMVMDEFDLLDAAERLSAEIDKEIIEQLLNGTKTVSLRKNNNEHNKAKRHIANLFRRQVGSGHIQAHRSRAGRKRG